MSEASRGTDKFPETRWGLIVRISGNDPDDRNGALEVICALYRPPFTHSFATSDILHTMPTT
jgi:hypothetical protein